MRRVTFDISAMTDHSAPPARELERSNIWNMSNMLPHEYHELQ
jgi:hypothetical protein